MPPGLDGEPHVQELRKGHNSCVIVLHLIQGGGTDLTYIQVQYILIQDQFILKLCIPRLTEFLN